MNFMAKNSIIHFIKVDKISLFVVKFHKIRLKISHFWSISMVKKLIQFLSLSARYFCWSIFGQLEKKNNYLINIEISAERKVLVKISDLANTSTLAKIDALVNEILTKYFSKKNYLRNGS